MGLEIIGAGLQHRASKRAASAQKEAAYEANQTARDLSAKQMDLYKQIYDEQKAQQAPYLQQGQAAIGKLGSLMGLKQKMTPQEKGNAITSVLTGGGNPSPIESNNGIKNYNTLDNPLGDPFKDYLAKSGLSGGQFNQNNPQYQFLLKQGQQALDRSAAARGMGYSGAQLKAAQQFGQGLASQQYDKEYDRTSYKQTNQVGRFYEPPQQRRPIVCNTHNCSTKQTYPPSISFTPFKRFTSDNDSFSWTISYQPLKP